MANWPQQGYRQAGKEKHRLEDLLHMSTRCQLGGQCSLGLGAACVHGQQSTSVLLVWDPEGLLSCAVHLDNLRSQGQHSERGLKHLEKLSLWQAHITPCLLVHHCLFWEDLPLEGSA